MPASDWKDLCPETVDYKQVVSRNEYTKPTYGAATSYRCRIVRKNVRVANARQPGTDVIASIVIWVLGLPTIGDIDDQFSQGGVALGIVVNWERQPDENGPHHVKVFLGAG